MAEALLRVRFARRGLAGQVSVGSAGLMDGGVPVSAPVLDAVRAYGADLGAHRSRRLTAEMLDEADLVLGLAAEHARAAVGLRDEARPRTFTLGELARRCEVAGPRRDGESLPAYLARLDGGRGDAPWPVPSSEDDVADPYGRPVEAVAETAKLIDDLLAEAVAGLWPDT